VAPSPCEAILPHRLIAQLGQAGTQHGRGEHLDLDDVAGEEGGSGATAGEDERARAAPSSGADRGSDQSPAPCASLASSPCENGAVPGLAAFDSACDLSAAAVRAEPRDRFPGATSISAATVNRVVLRLLSQRLSQRQRCDRAPSMRRREMCGSGAIADRQAASDGQIAPGPPKIHGPWIPWWRRGGSNSRPLACHASALFLGRTHRPFLVA
jgi:hypothetical protein